jgi:hypothetical protein
VRISHTTQEPRTPGFFLELNLAQKAPAPQVLDWGTGALICVAEFSASSATTSVSTIDAKTQLEKSPSGFRGGRLHDRAAHTGYYAAGARRSNCPAFCDAAYLSRRFIVEKRVPTAPFGTACKRYAAGESGGCPGAASTVVHSLFTCSSCLRGSMRQRRARHLIVFSRSFPLRDAKP